MQLSYKDHQRMQRSEFLSALTHGIGLFLAVIGTILLVTKAVTTHEQVRVISFAIFGAALITLYAASTLYHTFYNAKFARIFKIMDHSGVYILIAGSYTPYCLVAIGGLQGTILLAAILGLSLLGIILKVWFVGRFKVVETVIYVVLGWLCITAAGPLLAHLGTVGFGLLLAGGLAYTLGAGIYLIHNLPYQHVIWHIFVMLGSLSMFLSVYFFV